MSNKTLRITYGAMLIAIFAVFMMINRQTGGMLSSVMLFILPIPIVAYAVKYGGKASLAVFFCMVVVSILFGTLSTAFYGISAALIGLVYGTCLYHKVDMTKTFLAVVGITVVVELIDMVVIAGLMGIGIEQDMIEIEAMFNEMAAQANVQFPEAILEEGSLRRLILISIAFSGALEGFVIYGLTIIVLRKLRIPVQKMTPVSDIYPPRWTGIAAGAAWLWYTSCVSQQSAISQGLVDGTANTILNRCVQNEMAMGITQVVGMVGYLFLVVFGIIALSMIITKYLTRNKAAIVVLSLLGVMMFAFVVMILGIVYVSGTLHDRLLGRQMSY